MWRRYKWEAEKERNNVAIHGVSFGEAATVPDGLLSRWFSDKAHSRGDDRWLVISPSSLGRLLLVVVSEGGPEPRIISAWRATKRERREYEGR